MIRSTGLIVVVISLMFISTAQAFQSQVIGEITEVSGKTITASFPAQVRTNSMMIIYAGENEDVAGMAVAEKCWGKGPCSVRGRLAFISKAESISTGKRVYVNSVNAAAIPEVPVDTAGVASSAARYPSADQDLGFYYYAADQPASYGVFGVGYERSVRFTRGIAFELDAGITGIGSLDDQNGQEINVNQSVKSLNGKLKLDFFRGMGAYTAYRWSQGKGDDDRWNDVTENLQGKTFNAKSDITSGNVRLQGLEYGLTLRPVGKLAMSVGYIPALRTDYGSYGVRSEPGYSGELRLGTKYGAIRLRGITSDDYWLADLGITIR